MRPRVRLARPLSSVVQAASQAEHLVFGRCCPGGSIVRTGSPRELPAHRAKGHCFPRPTEGGGQNHPRPGDSHLPREKPCLLLARLSNVLRAHAQTVINVHFTYYALPHGDVTIINSCLASLNGSVRF